MPWRCVGPGRRPSSSRLPTTRELAIEELTGTTVTVFQRCCCGARLNARGRFPVKVVDHYLRLVTS